MVLLVMTKITPEDLQSVSIDLDGYIKFVVDIEKRIATFGGRRHVEGEELLLKNGSHQENLWGGGYDLESEEMDFDSMINIRPAQNNPSREVLSLEIRNTMKEIVILLL
jgi:hypothetical protein